MDRAAALSVYCHSKDWAITTAVFFMNTRNMLLL